MTPTGGTVVAAAAVATWALVGGRGAPTAGGLRRLDALSGVPRMCFSPAWPSWSGRGSLVRTSNPSGVGPAALFMDLVAAGLAAGATVAESVIAVTRVLPATFAARLEPVCAALALGADPAAAWAPLRADPELRAVAVALTRAAASGAPAAGVLADAADEMRARRAAAASAAARAAGVRAVAPLGLCFLPAFVLLAVVPTVVGLASSALPGVSS